MESQNHLLLDIGDNNPILVYGLITFVIIFMTAILHSSRKGSRISKYMKI